MKNTNNKKDQNNPLSLVSSNSQNSVAGYRKRLRELILRNDDLPDYVVLSSCLFAAFTRQDTHQLAKKLIKLFGSLADVIMASQEELRKIPGIGMAAIASIKTLKLATEKLAKAQLKSKVSIRNLKTLIEYLRVKLGHKKIEECLMLFLNDSKEIICDEIHQTGTVNCTSIYSREIAKRALEKNASLVIIAHNHPNGYCDPSNKDIASTREIQSSLNILGIHLFDHIIISPSEHFSFRNKGLL